MKPHLAYLKYVLIHKFYVYMAGRLLGVSRWRLLVHDLSKFSRAEWSPYVKMFYGINAVEEARIRLGLPDRGENAAVNKEQEALRYKIHQERKAAFDRAWLHHLHSNPHHWQYWVLREDDGVTKILLPHAKYVREMVADWIGAGQKILKYPSLRECVVETAHWYNINRDRMLMRKEMSDAVEALLLQALEDA